MPQLLEHVGYRAWEGTQHSPWWTCLTLVRVGVWLIFRRWIFWALIGLGMMNFLFHFAIVYIKATLAVQDREVSRMMDQFQLTGTGNAYAEFMNGQSFITALLLAFAGSTLIGNDYRQGGMIFYLSRSIGKTHYIVGKLMAIATVVLLITMIPALILYVEYGLLSSSFDYFREEWRIGVGIVAYGLILAAFQSLLLFAIAAWVPRTVPLVMTWLGMFTLLTLLAHILDDIRDNRHWLLFALWENMFRLGRWAFGAYPEDRIPRPWECALVLGSLGLVSLLLIIRRVRAVEVVS
jgi:ABC-2 type transport system permease protein